MRRPVGVKSILFSFREATFVLPPSGRCRHASIRTLEERFVSLGACWAFSFQPVLPSVWRPCGSALAESNLGQAINAVTGTRLWAFDFSLPGTVLTFVLSFCSTQLPPLSFGCCCAMVGTPLRSPTSDAAAPPAFLRWRRWLASSRFSRRVGPASVPSVAGHSRCRMVPRYVALPAPATYVSTDRLPC